MTLATHSSSQVDAASRGHELGVSLRDEIHATWAEYDRLFAEHELDPGLVRGVGEHCLAEVDAWAPRLAEEIAGIAAGAGLELWQLAALNARSEVLAHFRPVVPGECSTAVYLPEAAPPRTVQTWDWHAGMAATKLIWQYRPGPERTVKTFTECGMLAKIGVNSAGLGVHFNLLLHDADGADDGVPVHLIARRVLDEAGSIDEAEQIIRETRVSASVALTVVAGGEGGWDACTFEVAPAGVARIPVGPDGFLLRTNHFLDAGLATGERLVGIDPDTCARHEELLRRAPALRARSAAERTAALVWHREDGAALCCHPDPEAPATARWESLAVIGIEPAEARLIVHEGSPCAAGDGGWLKV